MALNSPWISSMWRARAAPIKPWRSSAITSPSLRPRWAASWYRMTSSNAAPKIALCWRMSSSRRSPAALITTLRRLPDAASMASTALASARIAAGVGAEAGVGNGGGARVVHDVEAPGGVVAVVDKARQAAAQRLPRQAHAPGGGHGGHHVVDLEGDRAVARDRHVAQMDGLAPRAFRGHDAVAIDIHGAVALGAVRDHPPLLAP